MANLATPQRYSAESIDDLFERSLIHISLVGCSLAIHTALIQQASIQETSSSFHPGVVQCKSALVDIYYWFLETQNEEDASLLL